MTLRPLPFALALSLAVLPTRSGAADNAMLGIGPRAIPAPPAATQPLPPMRSVGLVVGGLTVGGLGVAGAIVGLFLMNASSSQDCPQLTSPAGCVYTVGVKTCSVVRPLPCSIK